MTAPDALHTRYLTVILGEDLYAVPLGAVKDVRGSCPVVTLAGVPPYVVGRLDQPGVAAPVLDLRRRLGIGPQASAAPAVHVVLDRAGRVLVLRADAVADVVDLGIPDAPAGVDGPDPRADLAWLRGVAAAGDRMVLMLDLDQLLAPAERAAVDAAIAADRARAA
ncbi:MAG: chemotaxis protein CheW [Xanthomonadaceae bacterium]|nr:chemotaxis protein CheW [Xanthomonadaceae bacterium]MDE1965433.1 chemotaxis protein CheW [Xanthomonadaceae bacterium]